MQIYIYPEYYDVCYDLTQEQIKSKYEKDYPCAGLFDSEEQRIYVAKDQSVTEQQSTLVHEIIEALNFKYRVGLREQQIVKLERGIFNFLTDLGVNVPEILDKA